MKMLNPNIQIGDASLSFKGLENIPELDFLGAESFQVDVTSLSQQELTYNCNIDFIALAESLKNTKLPQVISFKVPVYGYYPKRVHKKKRIQKKWLRRFGIEHGIVGYRIFEGSASSLTALRTALNGQKEFNLEYSDIKMTEEYTYKPVYYF